VKFLEAAIPEEYFAAVGEQLYSLDVKVDQDTPVELCQLGRDTLTEESEFCFLQILLLSDNIYFGVKSLNEKEDGKKK
jgi:hypothetical protein